MSFLLKNSAIDALIPAWQEYLEVDDAFYVSQSVYLDISFMSFLFSVVY
jgi:hypothetical protein